LGALVYHTQYDQPALHSFILIF